MFKLVQPELKGRRVRWGSRKGIVIESGSKGTHINWDVTNQSCWYSTKAVRDTMDIMGDPELQNDLIQEV